MDTGKKYPLFSLLNTLCNEHKVLFVNLVLFPYEPFSRDINDNKS